MEQLDMQPDPYRNCKNAISWVTEYCVGTIEELRLFRRPELTVDDLVANMKAATKEMQNRPYERGPNYQKMMAAMPEFDLPEFRQWLLAAVWGSM